MEKPTVVLDYYDHPTAQMFREEGWEVVRLQEAEKATLACFTGGADVNPSLYGEEKHPETHTNLIRDSQSSYLYNAAKRMDIPCVGICRGGQFLNVMMGGKLQQHIGYNTPHFQTHMVFNTFGGVQIGYEYKSETLYVSSDHHQAILPTDEGVVLFKAIDDVVEAVVYSDTLCVQFHPEWVEPNHECYIEFQKMLKLLMEGSFR